MVAINKEMKVVCNRLLNFTKGIGMRIKRDEEKIDLVTICQSCKSYNSVILDKLEQEDLIELLNIINGDNNSNNICFNAIIEQFLL